MDCQKLYKDIEQLKSLRDELKDKYDASVESGLGKTALQNLSKQASANADEVLGEYLDDFFEHNPEIPNWKVGDLIKGFDNEKGNPATILSLTPLPDGSVMAGGEWNTLCNLTKDQNGNWQVGNLIPGFEDKKGGRTDITSLIALPDGSIMAGGLFGALYNMTKDQNGNWQVGGLIEGFDAKPGSAASIHALTLLPDGSVMAGGGWNTLCNLTKDQNGNWRVGYRIKGFRDASGFEDDIVSLATLPDGSVMAGGNNGALYNIVKDQNGDWQVGDLIPGFECKADKNTPRDDRPRTCITSLISVSDGSVMVGVDAGAPNNTKGALYNMTKDRDGNWQVGDLIPGFKNAAGYHTNIPSLTATPDGSVIAGGEYGALYNMTKDQNGDWQVGDLIPGFKDRYGNHGDIKYLALLPDGSVMAGGEKGALRVISCPEKTLETLKNSLQQIAEKKEKQ